MLKQHWTISTWHAEPYQDYSAMRWPCPEGFHIPSETEINYLLSPVWVLGTFGLTSNTNLKTMVHFVPAWLRGSDWNVNTTGGWRAIRLRTRVRWTDVRNSMTTLQNPTTQAMPIRAFKDEYVQPDGSWTTLYDWSSVATWAWVFHNPTLGLISCNDWNHYITIQDKNVWATIVYNDWDTITNDNAWNMFQRWNNYWFPARWDVTTSATTVDASSYPPSTYSSNIYVITYSDWDTSGNADLRWNTTWIRIWYRIV